jgi:hypothetical protein
LIEEEIFRKTDELSIRPRSFTVKIVTGLIVLGIILDLFTILTTQYLIETEIIFLVFLNFQIIAVIGFFKMQMWGFKLVIILFVFLLVLNLLAISIIGIIYSGIVLYYVYNHQDEFREKE